MGPMTVPQLLLSPVRPLEAEADVLVLGVFKTEQGPRLAATGEEFEPLRTALPRIGVTGDRDELHRLPAIVGTAGSIALIGLGGGEPDAAALRTAAGAASRQLRGVESLAVALPTADEADVLAVLEGAGIGAYAYTEYRAGTLESTKLPAKRVTVLAEAPDALVERASAVVEAMETVRDLVNASPADLYPETFAETAAQLAGELPVQLEVLDEAALEAGGFGGLLGVGRGSTRGSRLVKVSYSPAGASGHLALVGKGITFDSGGLSLKPPASMVGMKYDMTGAATVLAVVLAAARIGVPLRITAWLCLAENMPSGSATRPNDVLRIRGGKTVEVLNTDAEGRLVLADGLVAASEEQPDWIVDVATLTGAAKVALGNRYTGVMGDRDFVQQVVDAGTAAGELLWPMPIPEEVRPMLNSDIADIANAKPGETAAGMLLGAAFLRDFIGSRGEGEQERTIPWAHLDIAGPANNGAGGWGFTGKGPTGVTVRALLTLSEMLARPV